MLSEEEGALGKEGTVMGWFIVAMISLGLCFTLWAHNKSWAERFVFLPLGWIGLGLALSFIGVGIFSAICSLSLENYEELERALWLIVASVFMLVIVGINVLSEKNNMRPKKEV